MSRLRPDALTWREVDGEIVALELATSTYLAVNHTGAVLWGALAAGVSDGELVAQLVQVFDVTAEEATRDVEAFLMPLRQRGLLEE